MAKAGSCLCGEVRFLLHGELRPVLACHCQQCRKTSGHYWAATNVPVQDLELTQDKGLTWYQSSEVAKRGFCGICGSSLFWQWQASDTMSIAAGSLDGVTGLTTEAHIFTDDKGDYYGLPDDEFVRSPALDEDISWQQKPLDGT